MTFRADLVEHADIESHVAEIARDVAGEVTAAGRTVRRVSVTVRTRTFYTRTKITTLPVATDDVDAIEAAAVRVLSRFTIAG